MDDHAKEFFGSTAKKLKFILIVLSYRIEENEWKHIYLRYL